MQTVERYYDDYSQDGNIRSNHLLSDMFSSTFKDYSPENDSLALSHIESDEERESNTLPWRDSADASQSADDDSSANADYWRKQVRFNPAVAVAQTSICSDTYSHSKTNHQSFKSRQFAYEYDDPSISVTPLLALHQERHRDDSSSLSWSYSEITPGVLPQSNWHNAVTEEDVYAPLLVEEERGSTLGSISSPSLLESPSEKSSSTMRMKSPSQQPKIHVYSYAMGKYDTRLPSEALMSSSGLKASVISDELSPGGNTLNSASFATVQPSMSSSSAFVLNYPDSNSAAVSHQPQLHSTRRLQTNLNNLRSKIGTFQMNEHAKTVAPECLTTAKNMMEGDALLRREMSERAANVATDPRVVYPTVKTDAFFEDGYVSEDESVRVFDDVLNLSLSESDIAESHRRRALLCKRQAQKTAEQFRKKESFQSPDLMEFFEPDFVSESANLELLDLPNMFCKLRPVPSDLQNLCFNTTFPPNRFRLLM